MELKELLSGINYNLISGNININVNQIQYDSRNILPGDIFICIKGFKVDGHNYINKAVANGAKIIIVMDDVAIIEDVTVIKVEDTRKAMAFLAANFYGKPSKKMKVIGITGTNGKTTSAFMLKAILEEAGFKTGVIGTIANYIGDKKVKAERTTPESLELQKLFKDMVDEKVDYCIMEVSSHSLSLDRVYGTEFDYAIFTNLTRDHLDFHKTFEEYYEAKLKLFKTADYSIVNIDDTYGVKVTKDINSLFTSFGIENSADLTIDKVDAHSRGIDFEIKYEEIQEKINLNIPGLYNVYNALGCIGICLKENISIKAIKKGLNEVVVPGRCELVAKEYNLDFEIIIDYAHSPDGLENILTTAKEFTKNRLVAVFGCGGDRDKEKRPMMGEIGATIADIAIITSDNPRSEEPMDIINDVLAGVPKDAKFIVEENRKEAIKKAIRLAQKGDVIVIAGKGHEDYQILKDKTIDFDERIVVKEILEEEN
ncbi:UDP-N-acetylmuramoyl-L-alanyl-D-glutamate--2,6-diaminopimelate ligase [Clostridium grantii]|uniref:UDP-N-acetylmuramoyl-L-alanyl-D-glutamate--2,6-diaminopimelate ligase n=1 Tax=Clostridium grantii DSM 8605 TaxID=1121316 RepID=A0A1M5SHQ8_9CLOT|nr:UDP-N-acetylmuramoyl-L-alanyl-D-glutamate--2,6-diaminopimelate ligase [Clostridium grantii]SHH38084.1 UDP-N-acetylmuramoylalanyl-D-glutamate--2,6-diaminopimelate ligase [Clostridium grantii DSM 8605]